MSQVMQGWTETALNESPGDQGVRQVHKLQLCGRQQTVKLFFLPRGISIMSVCDYDPERRQICLLPISFYGRCDVEGTF